MDGIIKFFNPSEGLEEVKYANFLVNEAQLARIEGRWKIFGVLTPGGQLLLIIYLATNAISFLGTAGQAFYAEGAGRAVEILKSGAKAEAYLLVVAMSFIALAIFDRGESRLASHESHLAQIGFKRLYT